jgi:hypothetical protein
MAGQKRRDIWQYGDFQTPPDLALDVCSLLVLRGIDAPAILEPTCGRGAFVGAAANTFPHFRTLLGVELNAEYVAAAEKMLKLAGRGIAKVEQGDFFTTDWDKILARDAGPWLIVGNPPWVTNAELGLLKSTNLPIKSNFQGHQGLDAITGKANFDISEWMMLEQISWLRQRSGWIAMLVKTSVARKVLRQAWKRSEPVGRAAIFKIDAMRHFGAAVDACLFVLPVNIGDPSLDCDVYASLGAAAPSSTIGSHDGLLVSNVAAYVNQRHLIAPNNDYVWRSGVKHDCSKIMELSIGPAGRLVNGNGDEVCIEGAYMFPMLKSSDVANGRMRTDRFMIVTQRTVGGNTSEIETLAPKTWRYLLDHAEPLDARGSIIYRKKPRFSIFGVGDYTFAPWKVAVSGFYKEVRFVKVGPLGDRPVVFDDTIYFLPCWSEEEADFVLTLVQSTPFRELMEAMIFEGEKRTITAELLKRIALERVAAELGLGGDYTRFTPPTGAAQFDFALSD